MPVSVSVIPELNVVHIVYWGRLTIQDLIDETIKRHQNPAFQVGMPGVNDLTQVTEIDIGFDEMLTYTKQALETYREVTTPIQLCLVGDTKATAAAVAMYENLSAATNAPFHLHIVQGYPEVLAVLNLPPDSLKHFPEFCHRESHLL